jgi:hypothetical protein
MRACHIVLSIGLLSGFIACGGDDATPPPTGGTGGSGGSGGATGGSGGKTADASVDTSTGGTGGAAGSGTAGSGGASGSGGAGGTSGKGGAAGSATGGAAGATAGTAGSGGAAGKGGSAGTAGSSGAGGAAGTAGAGGAAGTAGAGGAAGSAGTGGAGGTDGGASVSVLQHHNNATRDGVFVDPVFTKAAVATLHIDTTFAMATYAASVLAQPLYLASNATVPDLVIVATTQNHVIGFNAGTGAKVYDRTLAPPTPSSALACSGNINPVGVVGTPVIDPATRTLYLNSMTNMSGTPQDMVHAIDADTGATRAGWPVDLNATAKSGSTVFTTKVQNQRGALGLVGGRVLIPYGGHIGDCGDYRGWVVSISASDPTQMSTFATRALGGGIWAPSGVASDGTSVFFATGNTMGAVNDPTSHPAMYGDGESVFKLPPTLTQTGATTEYFVPTNWITLDDTDADLGGTGPLLVDVPGATPSKLIVQLGKDRKAYLIDRDNMGGQSAPLAAPTVAGNAIINAAVSYRTAMGTYVVFRGSGSGCPAGMTGSLIALRITAAAPPQASVVWCAGVASNKSPAVSMVNASGTDTLVWLIGNDNRLRAYDGDTGAVVFNGGGAGDVMAGSSPFITPIIANGRIFAAANTQTYAFRP